MAANQRIDEDTKPFLVYYSGRRTPVAVRATSRSEAITKAGKLKRRGGEKVVSVRIATAQEQKTAASGGWIRTGPKGEAPGKSKLRGYGPKPKGHSDSLSLTELEAYNAALESRADEITQWRSDGRSEVYIETRLIEGLRNDGVIGERVDAKNEPTNPELWKRAIAEAKKRFNPYPSRYANNWASRWYQSKGGKWKASKQKE